MSAQLLGEILLHRANVKAMMRYVSEVDNLKLMMVLLKDQSRSIQFEAFHVFKARPPFTAAFSSHQYDVVHVITGGIPELT